MIIIWKALIEYLSNNLRAGRSVNIKRFGSFTFDIETELPRIATKSMSMTATNNFDLEDQRLDRKHVHKVRPCFVVDEFLQPHLIHYAGKEEILPAKSQKSIYQKGFRMIYCNPVPISAACLLGKEIVNDALNTIFLAIVDLIKYNRDINLNFGFARISIVNRGLRVTFANDYKTTCVDKTFENQMKRSTTPVSNTWKSSYTKTFAQSTLGTLLAKPNTEVVKTLNEKTLALKMMSLDLSSSGKFFSATSKGPFFPSTT
jgi:nucleoid DNA-binding protein